MNVERHCLSAECGTRNAERLRFASAPLTRKDYMNAERRMQNDFATLKLRKQGESLTLRK